MKAFRTEDGEFIIVQDGETLQQVIDRDHLEPGEDSYITVGPTIKFYTNGEHVRTMELIAVDGHRKVNGNLEGWIIEDGDQLAVAVCRDGRDVIIGHDTMESALKHLYSL